ncbi:hypothetical protein K474DRAFT_1776934 [Panus rudis PR-1116 ss-1]|nr:hypothetical protein K474DRAFT_1776934 [Panus rudis PR-1116 ss-1]
MSTEPCEHVFSLCRLTVKDFTMLDFIYMVPKLTVQLRKAFFTAKVTAGNTTASGYHHTYMNSSNTALPVLRVFPSDVEINRIAETAYQEAMNLWGVLGIAPASLPPRMVPSWFTVLGPNNNPQSNALRNAVSVAGTSHGTTTVVHRDKACAPNNLDSDSDSDHESDEEDEFEEDLDEITEAEVLDELLAAVDFNGRTERDSQRLMKVTSAAVSLLINDTIDIHELPEFSANEMEDEMTSVALWIAEALADCRLPIRHKRKRESDDMVTPETSDSTDSGRHSLMGGVDNLFEFNFDEVVSIRHSHQSYQAATGTRRGKFGSNSTEATCSATESESISTGTKLSSGPNGAMRRELIQKFYATISRDRELNGKRVGTGLERAHRWKTSPSNGTKVMTGNAANAATAANAQANRLLARRREVFRDEPLKHLPILQDGGVSKLALLSGCIQPIKEGQARVQDQLEDSSTVNSSSYLWVLVNGEIQLARVLSLYTRGGGKHGSHKWVSSVASITSLSYIAVQLYEHDMGDTFSALTSGSSRRVRGQKKRYAFLAQAVLLCTLTYPPRQDSSHELQVSRADYQCYVQLTKVILALQAAVRKLGKRRGKKDEDELAESGTD